MCSRMRFSGERVLKPGQEVPVRSKIKAGKGIWAGFARSETAGSVWRGWILLDIPAQEFAENNRATKALSWGTLEAETVIYALGDRKTGQIKVLTREATAQEKAHYGHHRVPLTGPKRF